MRGAVIALLLVALAAGCGDDKKPAVSETRPNAETVTAATATTPSTRTGPASVPGADPPATTDSSAACGQLGRLRLEVINGDVSCGEVRQVAGEFDLAGKKVQEVRAWTCSGGTAQTRPIVFTCTLAEQEFVAQEGGG